MSVKNRRWLLKELPGLVETGILSEYYAEALREHYADAEPGGGRSPALTVCGILGALLIGGGVILLFGHNWNAMSRSARTVLALAPLVITQALGVMVLRGGRRSSRAWREPVAGINCLAVAAAIALVGQTYHIPGDLPAFLLVWMLLTLPLVYLFRAVLPFLVYLAGITVWGGSVRLDGVGLWYWPLYAAALPFAIGTLRREPFSPAGATLGWGLCLQAAWIGTVLERGIPGGGIVIYTTLFALLALIGASAFDDAPSAWCSPFAATGWLGTLIVALTLTYEWPWKHLGWEQQRLLLLPFDRGVWVNALLAAVLLTAVVALLARQARRGRLWRMMPGLAPVAGLLGWSVVAAGAPVEVGLGLFNLLVFAAGVALLARGVREDSLAMVNGGMGVLSLLLLLRFFDGDIPMLVRGVLFVALGAGFLLVNFRRRTRPVTEERQ